MAAIHAGGIDGSRGNVLSPCSGKAGSPPGGDNLQPRRCCSDVARLPHSPPAALTTLLIGRGTAQQIQPTNRKARLSRPRVSRWQQSGCGWRRGGQPVATCALLALRLPPHSVTLGEEELWTIFSPQFQISHCCRRRVMDLQAVIVFVGGFAFCAVVGYIVSVFGAKEQVSSLFVVHRPLFVNIL